MHPLFECVRSAIEGDIGSMVEDGYDREELIRELESVAAKGSVDALLAFEQDLWSRPSRQPYDEPNDWESISRTFPDGQAHARFAGTKQDLLDRIHGAWLGRVAGCQLGKPLEMAWPEETRRTLEACDSWPLDDYIKPIDDPARIARLQAIDGYGKRAVNARSLARGHFRGAAVDDDTTYSVAGLCVLEKHGIHFTSDQASDVLVNMCPRSQLACAGLNMFMRRMWGMRAPDTARFGNWCRQSLGAMIRCDPFGWASPANPALAARMAYEDARGSQTRNGIYSGIFFAVLMADIVAHSNVTRAIDTALAYVPSKSRFAEMVRFTLDLCRRESDWERANDAIYRTYDKGFTRGSGVMGNHAIPNAAIVLMSLLQAGGDFSRAICIATMAGMDTDCNAATAGSIMGLAVGAGGIDRRWTEPLDDTLHTQLVDHHVVRISDLARRTWQIADGNCRYAHG